MATVSELEVEERLYKWSQKRETTFPIFKPLKKRILKMKNLLITAFVITFMISCGTNDQMSLTSSELPGTFSKSFDLAVEHQNSPYGAIHIESAYYSVSLYNHFNVVFLSVPDDSYRKEFRLVDSTGRDFSVKLDQFGTGFDHDGLYYLGSDNGRARFRLVLGNASRSTRSSEYYFEMRMNGHRYYTDFKLGKL